MKKKIISFIGLLLFVGVVVFNIQLTNNNHQLNEVKLENIEARAACSGEYAEKKWDVVEKCDNNQINCVEGGSENCCLEDHCNL